MSPLASKQLISWLLSSYTGASSKAIAATFAEEPTDYSYPHDIGDFARCLTLMEWVPEIKSNRTHILHTLSRHSLEWEALEMDWEAIESCFFQEVGPIRPPYKNFHAPKANKMLYATLALARNGEL